MADFALAVCDEPRLMKAPRALRFSPGRNFGGWQKEVREKLRELLGSVPEKVALDVQVESETDHESHREIRYIFTSEAGAQVPCHLLLPKGVKGAVPAVVCLQGHSPGMHISLGVAHNEAEQKLVGGDRDYGLQVVRLGYAALVMEQRCFGERREARDMARRGITKHYTCHHSSVVALMLGRTMVGQRVWDVMRAIDSLGHFKEVDGKRVGCMGNSGGGTVTYYAAAMDERISMAMPSCSVCSWKHSIGTIDHCMCNYIPRIANFFDMGDVAGAIAPRGLVVVAGNVDEIFELAGVEESMAEIRQIYEAAGKAERCRLVVGEGGHRFYAKEAWPVFQEVAGLMGW